MDWFDRILAWGVERPHRVALTSGSRAVTYAELIGRAHGLAAYLSDVLADDGSPVAVVGHKEPEMVVGFLGAALAGHPEGRSLCHGSAAADHRSEKGQGGQIAAGVMRKERRYPP